MISENIIKQDCRYYWGDRPCRHHKREGVKCCRCSYYSPYQEKILIIKLAAAGDVLRTTSILPGLKKAYPDSHLTWITADFSRPVLENNPFLDRVIPLEPDGILAALTEKFSLAINLDTSPRSAALNKLVDCDKKMGFSLDERGAVVALNSAAGQWLRMSVFDDEKKANRKTCQTIMREIIGCPPPSGRIILRLTPAEEDFARDFSEKYNLADAKIRIGFNTGAGRRWRYKKWGRNSTLRLMELCDALDDTRILLYGGPEEAKRNRWLAARGPDDLVDTGTGNSLRQFFALLNLSDILITGDTLALHAAVALGKRVIALFGPTSAAEIDLYGRGEKIITPRECRCCYLSDCDVDPDCMSAITVETVFEAVKRAVDNLPLQSGQ